MNLNFAYLIFVVLIFPVYSANGAKITYPSPNNDGYIVQDCLDDHNDCSLYIKDTDGNESALIYGIPKSAKVVWHNSSVAEISISCGSPCKSSYFVDISSSQVDLIDMPLAFDLNEMLVAYAEADKVVIKRLFTEEKSYISRDFSPVASLYSAIDRIRFIDGKTIEMSYLFGPEFEERIEEIKFQLSLN